MIPLADDIGGDEISAGLDCDRDGIREADEDIASADGCVAEDEPGFSEASSWCAACSIRVNESVGEEEGSKGRYVDIFGLLDKVWRGHKVSPKMKNEDGR